MFGRGYPPCELVSAMLLNLLKKRFEAFRLGIIVFRKTSSSVSTKGTRCAGCLYFSIEIAEKSRLPRIDRSQVERRESRASGFPRKRGKGIQVVFNWLVKPLLVSFLKHISKNSGLMLRQTLDFIAKIGGAFIILAADGVLHFLAELLDGVFLAGAFDFVFEFL